MTQNKRQLGLCCQCLWSEKRPAQDPTEHLSIQVDRIVGRNQICVSKRRTWKMNNKILFVQNWSWRDDLWLLNDKNMNLKLCQVPFFNFDFLHFATVNKHRDRRWNRTCVPVDITPSITHPAHKKLTTTPGTTCPTLPCVFIPFGLHKAPRRCPQS